MCEWSFQRWAWPGPCATDWRTTNGILCPERERERKRERGPRGDREKRGRGDIHREGVGVWGPIYAGLKCLITWPVWPLAPTQLRLSGCSPTGNTKPCSLKGHHSPPLCSRTPEVIGKSNVSDLHFPSLYRRAKLLRFPDNVKGRRWPFWLRIHCLYLASVTWSEKPTCSVV